MHCAYNQNIKGSLYPMFLILLYLNPQDLTLHIFLNFITFTKSSLKTQGCFGVDREVRGGLSRPQNNFFCGWDKSF